MVLHWKRQGKARARMIVNMVGAVATGITTLVVLVAKFAQGAWITVLLVAAMIVFMRAVNRHYRQVDQEIDLDRPFCPAEASQPIVVVPLDRWTRISEKALSFALSLSTDIRCVHVSVGDDPDTFCDAWQKDIVAPLQAAGKCIPKLITLKSPFRYIIQPIVDYVLDVERERPSCKICVLVPELVVRHWWDGMLHNRRSELLKVMLLVRGNRRVVVINIPWYLERD